MYLVIFYIADEELRLGPFDTPEEAEAAVAIVVAALPALDGLWEIGS